MTFVVITSLYSNSLLEAKEKSRKPRTGKVKVHPLGNNQRITQHFRPMSRELDKSKGPNDPELKTDQKTEDRDQSYVINIDYSKFCT